VRVAPGFAWLRFIRLARDWPPGRNTAEAAVEEAEPAVVAEAERAAVAVTAAEAAPAVAVGPAVGPAEAAARAAEVVQGRAAAAVVAAEQEACRPEFRSTGTQ
jgi:hypothetical protein